jgi:hypothetical protein
VPTEDEPARSLAFPSLILPICCYNRTLNTDNYNMEREAYRQNVSICSCFPARPCARGRYYLCERSVFGVVLARRVGNPLRPRSVIPCAKGRYSLRERSAFLVRKVCIFEALTADSCVSGRYSCGEAPTRSRPCVRGRYSDLSPWGCLGSPVNCASTRLPPRSRASLRQPRSRKACVRGRY